MSETDQYSTNDHVSTIVSGWVLEIMKVLGGYIVVYLIL